MNGLGNKFFSRAALTPDQNGCFTWRRPAHQREDLKHFPAFAYNSFDAMAFAQRFPQLAVLIDNSVAVAHLSNALQQFLQIHRFGQVIDSALLEGGDGRFDSAVRRD